jgi:uncharacterized membrane protein YfcA
MVDFSDPLTLGVIALGLAMGGILKGATGAGMPVIAVPVIAAFYDVRLAVIIIVIPNFVINMSQLYRYRAEEASRSLTVQMVLSGMAGAAIGTFALVSVPAQTLHLLMAGLIFVYIALRLLRPDFRITRKRALQTAWIAGTAGGVLQGSLGISSPAAITFLSAVKLSRSNFIYTASAFFAAMCISQFVLLTGYGLITGPLIFMGLMAVLPLMLTLPLGEWIGKRMSAVVFDRTILILLAGLGIKQALSGGLPT